ncbi:MAG: Crp/Fnr family transcriptional regulator [Xanthobacteraceae bacterium]|nr:Crp/Fnr family transcriptional regulator [Xanthobacteraceae bacterium]
MDLPRGKVLHDAGRAVDKVYFPEGGAVSLVVALATGEVIEIALIGHDGAVGGQEALQQGIALNRAVVQIEGPALAIDADWLRRIGPAGSEFRKRLEGYDRYIAAQAQQSAACNVAHSLDARLARWLLRAQDLCGGRFTLTQEAVAAFLGVRRTSVSLTAHGFQEAGLIRYRRGEIEIVNPDALRTIACECYVTLATHRERLLARPATQTASPQRVG